MAETYRLPVDLAQDSRSISRWHSWWHRDPAHFPLDGNTSSGSRSYRPRFQIPPPEVSVDGSGCSSSRLADVAPKEDEGEATRPRHQGGPAAAPGTAGGKFGEAGLVHRGDLRPEDRGPVRSKVLQPFAARVRRQRV